MITLQDEIYAFVSAYYKQFSLPCPLKILAQKYGKRAKRGGEPFLSFIESDSRYLIELTRSGAYTVTPLARVDLGKVIMVVIERNGGSLPLSTLRQLMTAQGTEPDVLSETIDRLNMIGSITIDSSEVVRIPDAVLGF